MLVWRNIITLGLRLILTGLPARLQEMDLSAKVDRGIAE